MNGSKEQQSYMSEQAKPTRHPSQVHMHSLLNVKLASLAENSYHNTMTPDAIASYYDESPDCSPPNGYHSPNPSPPNGFHSPNPTPPNGYLANTHAVFHDIVNPPIMFYGDDTVMGYDEDQFMKTMRILTSAHQYNDLHHRHQPSPTQQNLEHQQQRQRQQQEQQRQIHQQHQKQQQQQQKKQQQRQQKAQAAEKKRESISLESINDDTKTKEATPTAESPVVEELEIINNEEVSSVRRPPVLSKEDKRRRNTQASARFRVKKKLREQALQNTANEMTEKANRLQNRVHELEREVQWLKALIVEKKDSRFFPQ